VTEHRRDSLPAVRRVAGKAAAQPLQPALLLGAVLLALAAATPWVGNRYHVSFVFVLLMYLALTATYDIVGGYMGYINLGHGAFFGLGAYVYGIMVSRGGQPALALAFAAVAAAAFARLIAVPIFRLRGVYFAIATFGILKLLEVLAVNLDTMTGGTPGLSIPPTASTLPTFYLMLGAAAAGVGLNAWVANSRLGLGLVSVREDEEVAEASGIDTRRLKANVLMLSAVVPGVAGAIYMWQLTYINPTTAFGVELSFAPIIMAMLGGTGTLAGPLVGTVFLSLIEELLWSQLGYLHLTMYGLVLILVGVLMPGGLMRSRAFSRLYRALAIPDHYGYRSRPNRA
jgi:branched-chain amino acid transport system permease protein